MNIVTTDTPKAEAPGISDFTHALAGPTHTLSVYVNNQPGVLMRICQVFARRGYNIDSLVVSQGRSTEFSRMTIGISGDSSGLNQIIRQVGKLVDVIHCFVHGSENAVVKEMLLIKFKVGSGERTEALQIIGHFNGKTLDLTPTSMVAMLQGDSPKIDAAIRMLSQFDIIETVRTGKVVMARGDQIT